MGTKKPTRAIVAIALLIGFYLLAASVVIALVGVNVLFWNLGRVDLRIVIGTIVIGFGLVRAIFFVNGGFNPPSEVLPITAEQHPALFATISQIADQMDTSMPDVVMLIPDVNAFVVEDTAFLGLVSKRRYMAVGVALMNALTVDQLRAVIAHEFGHYAGADTRLGAIAYRGRESLVRAISTMGDGVIRWLFVGYAKFFWKTTAATNRAQELTADRWAAQVGGTEAAANALARIDHAAAAYQLLFNAYVDPLGEQKHRPLNLFEGYRHLLDDPTRQEQIDAFLARNPREPSPYDTHPPASERVANLRSLPAIAHTPDDRSAVVLLADLEQTERALTNKGYGATNPFKKIAWADAGTVFRDHTAGVGREIVALTGGRNGGEAEFLRRLVSGDLDGLRRDLSNTYGLIDAPNPEALRPYVRAAVLHIAGSDRNWEVNWAGPVTSGELDIDALTDALLQGGRAAEAARATLSENSTA